MTLKGLQAGFGNSLVDVLPPLKAQGCELVRIDCQKETADRTRDLAWEVIDAGMRPLVMVRVAEHIAKLIRGSVVLVGNEPELIDEGWNESPAVYWRTAGAAIAYCGDYGHPLFLGSVSNLNARGLNFLRGLPWRDIPLWVGVDHHWYPLDDRPHDSHITHLALKYPFKRRNTRDQDIAELRSIVLPDGGDRPLGMSETGWFNSPTRSEGEVAQWYAMEREFWEKHDYQFIVAYQIDDEVPPSDPAQWQPQHGYGFRELTTENWKLRTQAWFGEAA